MQWKAPPPDRIARAGLPTVRLPGKHDAMTATASSSWRLPYVGTTIVVFATYQFA